MQKNKKLFIHSFFKRKNFFYFLFCKKIIIIINYIFKFTRPKDPGIIRGTVKVEIEGEQLVKGIDINATSVDYSRYITDCQGTRLEGIDFGSVYFG